MKSDRSRLAAGLFTALAIAAPARAAHRPPPVWAMTPAFQVVVSLSPKAAARLAHPRETIIVDAEFYGEATPRGVKMRLGDEMDQISFPPETKVELQAAGVAHMAPHRFDKALTPYMNGGAVQVLINVYSGRRSSKDNLLDCGLFQDSVGLAARAPIPIRCKLIDEP